jgi:hypothetical protein
MKRIYHLLIYRGGIEGIPLLIEGLKYRLGLVVPYARTWDQVRHTISNFKSHYSTYRH